MTRERQIVEEIKKVLNRAGDGLKGYSVVLFGSRADGTATERSDFDVGIIGPRRLPLGTFYMIDDLLDAIDTLYRIDLVDLHEATGGFRQEALNRTEVLYE